MLTLYSIVQFKQLIINYKSGYFVCKDIYQEFTSYSKDNSEKIITKKDYRYYVDHDYQK